MMTERSLSLNGWDRAMMGLGHEGVSFSGAGRASCPVLVMVTHMELYTPRGACYCTITLKMSKAVLGTGVDRDE